MTDAMAPAESERAIVRDAVHRSRQARTSSWTTAYGLALIGAMLAAMALGELMQALSHHVAAGAGGWVPWALALAGLGAVTRGCVAIGPIHAEPDVARWLVPTPLRRRTVLRSRATLGLALAATAGAVAGVVVAVASHPGSLDWTGVLAALGVGTIAGAAAWVVALFAQSRSVAKVLGVASTMLVGACCVGVAVGMRASWAWGPPAGAGWCAAAGLAAMSLGVVLLAGPKAPRWADAVHARDAAQAGSFVSAVTDSVVMLDAGMFDVRRSARRLRRRGKARSRPSRGSVWADLVMRDLLGCLRRWPEVVTGVGLVVPAVMLGEIFGDGVGAVAVALAAWWAASRASEGLVTWLGSSSLWRILPQRPEAVTVCFAVAPALAAAVVSSVGAAACGLSWCFVPACVAAVVAGIVRRSKAPDMQLGTMVDLGGMGELPLGIVARLIHGPDVVVVVLVVGLATGPSGWTVAAVLAVVAVVLQLRAPHPASRVA